MTNVKSRTKATPARKVALSIGKTLRQNNSYASFVIEEALRNVSLDESEAAFARALALGVVSTSGTLDFYINKALRSPKDIKPVVRDALRISVYEMMFLDKTAHAAVDQGVELVRLVAPRATGVANHVLRRVAEMQSKKNQESLDSLDEGNCDIEKLAHKFGFPVWLTQKIIDDIGLADALVLLKDANSTAPVHCVVNSCKVSPSEIEELFSKEGISFQRDVSLLCYDDLSSYFLLNRKNISHPALIKFLDEGALVVSDLAAQAIACLALPESYPSKVLEIGAGRGTKTILLQSASFARFGRQMPLETVELQEAKTSLLRERVKKSSVRVDAFHTLDARNLDSLENCSFDVVFIDAPCTGVGTLRRHPDIRWRLKKSDSKDLAEITFDILLEASKKVVLGGKIVFATCTIFKEENSEVIERFLQNQAGVNFVLEPCNEKGEVYFVPPVKTQGSDIHFACVLRRVS